MAEGEIEAGKILQPQLEIGWERDDNGWRVTASYGDASLTLESTSEAGAQQLETLVQGLPQIMHHVYIDMSEKGVV